MCSPGANGLDTDRMKMHRLYMLMDMKILFVPSACLPHCMPELLDKGPKSIQGSIGRLDGGWGGVPKGRL